MIKKSKFYDDPVNDNAIFRAIINLALSVNLFIESNRSCLVENRII
jgi:hypothetical protein